MASIRRSRTGHLGITLLGAVTWAAVLVGLLSGSLVAGEEETPPAQAAAAATLDELDTIKERILEPLLEPVDAAAAQSLVDTLGADGSWPDGD